MTRDADKPSFTALILGESPPPKDMEKIQAAAKKLDQYTVGFPPNINPINNTAISQIPLNAEKRKAAPPEKPDLPDLPLPTDNFRDDIRPLDTPLNRLNPKPRSFNV